MADKTDIWMPLYIRDYLGDTMHLTTEQHGAYLLLLMHYWMNGPIPDDDNYFSVVTRLSPDDWTKVKNIVLKFFSFENGSWTQKRSEKEKNSSYVRKVRAKNAINERWKDTKPLLDPYPSSSSSSSEDKSSSFLPTGEILVEIPCIKGETYRVKQAEIDKFSITYPAIDVKQEILKAAMWCETHSANRKTLKGMPSFINGWLGRAQNKAPAVKVQEPPKKEKKFNLDGQVLTESELAARGYEILRG